MNLARLPILLGLRREDVSLETWLSSKSPEKQALADEVLMQMGEEKAFSFLTTAVLAEEKRRKARGLSNWVSRIAFSFAISIGTVALTHEFGVLHLFVGSALLFWMFVMHVVGGGLPSNLHRESVRRLTQLKDRRTFPYLVEAMISPYQFGTAALHICITEMLTEINEADFAKLSERQAGSLLQYVDPNPYPGKAATPHSRFALAQALLLASARLGRTDALVTIRRVAGESQISPEREVIRLTAINCLPQLERVKAENQISESPQRVVQR